MNNSVVVFPQTFLLLIGCARVSEALCNGYVESFKTFQFLNFYFVCEPWPLIRREMAKILQSKPTIKSCN